MEGRDIKELTAEDLLAGVREIFTETTQYYTAVQTGPIPIALTSEMTFSNIYKMLMKRKGEPAAATFLFGAENQAVRAEKSLFDLAMWIKEQPALLERLGAEQAGQICQRLSGTGDGAGWDEFRSRFTAHLAEYGHTIYELDFAKPTPADDPLPLVQALKAYLDGTAGNPYERQAAALERREQMTQAVVKRLDPLRRRWFLKLLKYAQELAPLREDGIADIGLGQPQIRRMLAELGRRLAGSGGISAPDDIYWLEAGEAQDMAAAIDEGRRPENHATAVSERKSKWQAMRKIVPPNVLPRNKLLARFAPRDDQQGDVLKGIGSQRRQGACTGLRDARAGRLRPDAAGGCDRGSHHHTGLDAAVRTGGGGGDGYRWTAQPQFDRGTRVRHPGSARDRDGDPAHPGWADDQRGWQRRHGEPELSPSRPPPNSRYAWNLGKGLETVRVSISAWRSLYKRQDFPGIIGYDLMENRHEYVSGTAPIR